MSFELISFLLEFLIQKIVCGVLEPVGTVIAERLVRQLLVRVCHFLQRLAFFVCVIRGCHPGNGMFLVFVRQDIAIHDRNDISDRLPVYVCFLAIPDKKIPMTA